MSRKIQEFFKSTPKWKAMESTEKIDFNPSKKIHREDFQNKDMDEISANDEKSRKGTKNCGHKCRICEKKFATTSKLLLHMKHVHPEQLKSLLDCQFCQLKFIKKKAFEQHMKVKHFDGKIQLFECDFCGKSIKTKGEIRNHMKMHLPTVECDICHAELKQLSIKSHMEETHAAYQKFQCKMCSKMFKSKVARYNHEKSHDKKFQCTTCMKTFSRNFELLKHQKEIHENPGSHSCEICNKKFNQKVGLRKHLKIHDRNRLKGLKCERCNFATDGRQSMKKHQKFHERQDEKFAGMKNPLKCPECPTLCKDKEALRKHLKNVHPDEPFQCDLCGIYIKTYGSVKNHINLHQRKREIYELKN